VFDYQKMPQTVEHSIATVSDHGICYLGVTVMTSTNMFPVPEFIPVPGTCTANIGYSIQTEANPVFAFDMT
jgi:hypothetical protein